MWHFLSGFNVVHVRYRQEAMIIQVKWPECVHTLLTL